MISQHNKAGLRNPWLLGMLGLIVLVLGVNITLVWYSTHHRSTLVEREYSTKDRRTNDDILREIQAQRELAWQTTIKRPKDVVTGTPLAYEVSVLDREGRPVSGTLEVLAYRPSDETKDFTTAFKEVSPGTYQGYINFPLKGWWELHVRVKRGDDAFGVNTERFMVAQAQ